MNPAPALTPEGEAAWARIRQHIEWCDHFSLGFIFSADRRVTEIFRERLADLYQARVTRLQTFTPTTAERLTDDLLPRLLLPGVLKEALHAPYWCDLSQNLDEEWRLARLFMLMRLNEQRETLRRAISLPIIFILPRSERAKIRSLIPDLWAIRDFSLEFGSWIADGAPITIRPETSSHQQRFPLSEYDQMLVGEWQRLMAKGATGAGVIRAGIAAADALQTKGHLDELERLCTDLERVARTNVAQSGNTPESLRDLSVSLDNVGDTAHAVGNLAEAEAAFAEGLEIGQALARTFPTLEDHADLPRHFEQKLAAIATQKTGGH